MSFRDKTCLLTGASSGIGRALAKALATEGCRMALLARRADRIESLAEEIRRSGGAALAVPCDVSRREEAEAAVKRVESELGPIDLLIANAGIGYMNSPLEFHPEQAARIMNVNVLGAIYPIYAALPGMIERKRGQVVGISSLASYVGFPRSGPYCASKAALSCFLEALRAELRGTGVSVTTINPGFVRTPLTDKNTMDMPFLLEPQQAVRRIRKGIRGRRRVVDFPWPMWAGIRLLRAMPLWLMDRLLARATSRPKPRTQALSDEGERHGA